MSLMVSRWQRVHSWLKCTALSGAAPLGLTPTPYAMVVPIYWLVIAGLVLGTFVDFEHFISSRIVKYPFRIP